MRLSWLLLPVLLVGPAARAGAAEPPREAAEFFEKHIRPVLAEQCWGCHGPKQQKAGLRLDSRAAALKGTDVGPVLVPGRPEQSSLLAALRHEGEVKMPPKGKLPLETVAAFADWVKMGLPWPDSPAARAEGDEAWKKHWAFQPVRRPEAPVVRDAAWAQTPVDLFILARLEARGLRPNPPADRRTLLRRVYFDLIGLPPTPAEVEAFLKDDSPEAFARVVDRLLASPHYGERWARHWLDLARYADTKGYIFTEERKFPYAYTYRDYVIRAFNEDLPYDRFILEQLAADQLPLGEDKRPLAAMGFLTLGRRFLGNVHDIIDDRIDVTTRGLLGLTVTCARCHDHKYDPIPMKDYYSLYGVFAGSQEKALALPVTAASEAAAAYHRELQAAEAALNAFVQAKHAEALAAFRAKLADYLLAGQKARAAPPIDDFMFVPEAGELNPLIIGRWRAYLDRAARPGHPVFGPWQAFAALKDEEFPARTAELARQFAGPTVGGPSANPRVARLFADKPPANLLELAQRYGRLFAEVDQEWQTLQRQAVLLPPGARPRRLADPAAEELRQVIYGPDAPGVVPTSEMFHLLDRAGQATLRDLQQKVDKLKENAPMAVPGAMTLEDKPTPYQPRVFLRGNPNNPGEAVPRQFLGVVTGPDRQPFTRGSGRLELAEAVVDPRNPLTARVLVNRVWAQHFGAGLVRTPSDFGLRSDPPSHPELLDYLALRFMADGWSVKKLHRLILLSRAYQQSSDDDPAKRAADPENTLLWKMNRRRLEFEPLRDALLAVGGGIDPAVGGPAVSITNAPFSRRRTVYAFIDRQNLPGLFRTFDFAGPDTHSPQRYVTTVPQQALFLLNSPFLIEQAKRLASRPEVVAHAEPGGRIKYLYRLLYAREATAEEVEAGRRFVATAPPEGLTPWEKYAQVLLMANEFAFVD